MSQLCPGVPWRSASPSADGNPPVAWNPQPAPQRKGGGGGRPGKSAKCGVCEGSERGVCHALRRFPMSLSVCRSPCVAHGPGDGSYPPHRQLGLAVRSALGPHIPCVQRQTYQGPSRQKPAHQRGQTHFTNSMPIWPSSLLLRVWGWARAQRVPTSAAMTSAKRPRRNQCLRECTGAITPRQTLASLATRGVASNRRHGRVQNAGEPSRTSLAHAICLLRPLNSMGGVWRRSFKRGLQGMGCAQGTDCPGCQAFPAGPGLSKRRR